MKSVIALAALSILFTGAAHADTHAVFGTFETPEKTSHITISDCGDGTPCGRVSWIDPASMQPGLTPETALTKTGDPVLGLLMLQGFDKKRRDWRGGTIYDPEADKSYASRLKRRDNGTLQVKGCIGPICQTQVWTEVSAMTVSAAD